MSLSEAQKKAIQIAKQHSEQNFVITYPYKGDLSFSKLDLVSGLRVLFTPSQKGQGGHFELRGVSSPLELKNTAQIFKIQLDGVFFKKPQNLQKLLAFSLGVEKGSTVLVLLLFENGVNVGSFIGKILGSEFKTVQKGTGEFRQLWLTEDPLDQIKETIKRHENTHPSFYNANKHILDLKQPKQFIVELSIPQKTQERRLGFQVSAYIRSASSLGLLGGKTFYFTAGDFFPSPPNHWQSSQNVLKLRGYFLADPQELPNVIGYSVNLVNGKSQFHLFVDSKVKGVFVGVTKSNAESYSGLGWFEAQGNRKEN